MMEPAPISWRLPMDRTHNGIPLANGVQGLLAWGTDRIVVTIGRAGFWDRRGGNPFLSRTTYREVKALLQAGDEAGLLRAFGKNTHHKDPVRPHQIGGGRLEIPLPPGWQVNAAELVLTRGEIRIGISDGTQSARVHIRQSVGTELAMLELPELDHEWAFHLRPAWEWIGKELEAVGCTAPECWHTALEQGFIQYLPEDPPLAVRVRRSAGCLLISSAVGPQAKAQTLAILDKADDNPWNQTVAFWENYWREVPHIDLPDPVLQEQVAMGLYLQACCTPPDGLACTLQGPLMECEALPSWSNDYHFNINLQMIYTPALATNRAHHFTPLWQLIRDWMPTLRASGKAFFEDPDALMLPHAVDDQCKVVGSFWTGSIDHGCTAWMALLAYDYWRYTQEPDCLQDLVWPLLKGAWAGFRAMLEEDGGGGWHLPVSVSPEYKGARPDAWGADSSFQLAALHAVLRALPVVAAAIGEPVDPQWAQVQSRTPPFTTATLPASDEYPEKRHERIVLWRGQDLDGSHRHHSHLAGITPFRTLDSRGADAAIIRNSLQWWTYRGPGAWSGWCLPWAAMIHARSGQPDAAVAWLHTWNHVFTNSGRASLHNANFPGFSTLADEPHRAGDIMQLDGRFGVLSAILELLVQDENDAIAVLPHIPQGWKDFRFDGIRAPGACLIGATVANGIISEVRVTSLHGNSLALRIGGSAKLHNCQPRPNECLSIRPEAAPSSS